MFVWGLRVLGVSVSSVTEVKSLDLNVVELINASSCLRDVGDALTTPEN